MKKTGWTSKPIKDNASNNKQMSVSPKGESVSSKKISLRFDKIKKHVK